MREHPEPFDSRSGFDPKRKQRIEPSLWLRQAGLLTAIPFVLLVGPVLGYFLGTKLDAWWAWAPWGVFLGCVLGLLASARVTIQFINDAKRLQRNDRNH